MKKLFILISFLTLSMSHTLKAESNFTTSIITGDDSVSFVYYQLINPQGKMVWENENKKTINLAILPKGKYTYLVRKGEAVIEKKYLIIE